MTDKEKITYNLQVIESMTQNGASPPLDEYWDEIVDLLGQDINKTRELMLNLSSNEIWLMGGYFEDIAYKLQDQTFIELLNELQEKYFELDMKQDIQWAIDALD